MDRKITLLRSSLGLLLSGTALSAFGFNNGDVMTFDPGEMVCPAGGTPPFCDFGALPVVTGSYFAMDYNNDGVFTDFEKTPIAPGPDGGIIIGLPQPAAGSHAGVPDGSEDAGIDAPWSFFANTGMHQTQIIPVVDNLDGTMNFRGWGVTWNGIPNIPLGGDSANFPGDTGLAMLNCSTSPCQPGVPYQLDYTAHVPLGDASGFGGVFYGVHLEIAGPVANVSLSVDGGTTQECASTGGNSVVISAEAVIPPGDTLATIDWTVDGSPAGSGSSITPFLSLGSHNITVDITTANGLSDSASEAVTVEDTIPPVVSGVFLDPRNGEVITTVLRSGPVEVSAEAADICDPAPLVNALIGAPIEDAQGVHVAKNVGRVSFEAPNLTLSVTAADASGNTDSAVTTLTIVEE